MKDYIFRLTEALYDPETGKAVFNPTVMGELIRCAECKKRRTLDCPFGVWDAPKDDDFCSRAERREG